MQENYQTSLRTFVIIWVSQFVSLVGSQMTSFATAIWAWEISGHATPLALMLFFSRTPGIIAATFAGVIVDRFNRKQMMMVGDIAAGFSTIIILLLLVNDNLAIWHLYVATAVNGLFGYFQWLAYSSSLALLVPKRHYTRATAMGAVTDFGSDVMAPAIAGVLYYAIGFSGILAIDIITFLTAVSTVFVMHIPQPTQSEAGHQSSQSIWHEITFGFRYFLKRPNFWAILIFLLSLNFIDSPIGALYSPLVLARSNNEPAVLASVQSALGIGGLVGALTLSTWGGPTRRIYGVLLGVIVSYISTLIVALGKVPSVWIVASFFAAFCLPFIGSSAQAFWISKVEVDVQGRVFASRDLVSNVISPLGLLLAGLLADYVFEPAMKPKGILAGLFGNTFGTGVGAGIALEFAFFSVLAILLGIGGLIYRPMRDIETIVPDHDATAG